MKKRLISILLAAALLVGLAVPAVAGGREFAFELYVNYTLDYEGYDPYTYSAYIRDNYDAEAFYSLPSFREIEEQYLAISDPWFEALYVEIDAAERILLPRPTPSEWIKLDVPFVFMLDDGSTLVMDTWDSSSGVLVSTETVTSYGGEDKIPQIVSAVSAPDLPGYTTTSLRVSNGTVTVNANPDKGYTAADYSGVQVPLEKLDGAKVTPPPVPPAPPAQLTAKPTASAVYVDGNKVDFDAYNIAGNNYFKLRDLAFILSGSAAQFEVKWDPATQSILIINGMSYTPVNGEMAAKGDAVKTPKASTAIVFIDGVLVELTAYNIDNNNYFKLRDIGEALDFEVDWDNDAQKVIIDTNGSYTAD